MSEKLRKQIEPLRKWPLAYTSKDLKKGKSERRRFKIADQMISTISYISNYRDDANNGYCGRLIKILIY